MLQTVDVGKRSLSAYRGIALDTTLDELVSAAEALRGARVLHLSATPYGGGVAELLRSLVPLLNDLGLVVDWKVISGDEAFFKVTKQIHDALQGADIEISDEERATYQAVSEKNAAELTEEYEVVVVHDPQPAGIRPVRDGDGARWIWRCHIDTSEPNAESWDFLRPLLTDYDAAVYTMEDFLPPDLPVPRVEIVPPAIDPLSPKNLTLKLETAREVLSWIGIELDQPLVTQVSRFDPWKDPLGVIEAYRLVREKVPDLQLALAGSMALDDPEAWEIHGEIKKESEKEPLIHVFTNLTGVGNVEVNALQRLSHVCIQKSIREGFGLVVSEALWKGTPMVAGRAGGIPLQMADGIGGILVENVEECAEALVELLENRERAATLGEQGRERVREHFLLTRLLLNEVGLLATVADRRAAGVEEWRDPACGMALAGPTGGTEDFGGARWGFCSEWCRERFRESPERYVSTRASDGAAASR
ncbi:MAG: glycosyltransferase [Gaiellaceae bacterium]